MGADTAPNSRLFDLARLEREKSDFEGIFQKTSEVEASSDLAFDGDAELIEPTFVSTPGDQGARGE